MTRILDRWRERIGLNDPFYLVGHSLGGFLVSHYTLRYPENVEKLLLVSPIGFNGLKEGETFRDKWDARNKLGNAPSKSW